MNPAKTAIIADDDKNTLRDLVDVLESENFNVSLALDTNHAIQLANKIQPLLVISEVANQNYDGISLFKYFKNQQNNCKHDPKLIALTSNSDEQYEILSYDTGIDFFLKKPLRKMAFKHRISKFFNDEEITSGTASMEDYQIRDLHFDIKHHLLYKLPNRNQIVIQSKSFDILLHLAKYPNQVFKREQLLEDIWGVESKVSLRTVDIHILKIRQALGDEYIKTIKGVGYIFKLKK